MPIAAMARTIEQALDALKASRQGEGAKLKPVLTVASGEEVTIETVSGGADVVPDRSKFHVPPELDDIHAKSERMVPGHILTGPIAVAGSADRIRG